MSGADHIVAAELQPNDQPILTSAVTDSSTPGLSSQDTVPVKQKRAVCRFYGTKRGCRAGSSCPYRHVSKHDLPQAGEIELPGVISIPVHAEKENSTIVSTTGGQGLSNSVRPPVKARQPLSKPVSAQQKTNPREFQIGQVIRRFAPARTESNASTVLSLGLTPSDPDFPFDLAILRCSLTVPSTWPALNPKPTLKVLNTEIPLGFQINIEKGFDSLVKPGRTLLTLLNDLDKNLEVFLSNGKAQTIKIVANRARPQDAPATPVQHVASSQPKHLTPVPPAPSWTLQQKQDAAAKRDGDIRQLESRMRRLSSFQKTRVGQDWSFNIPVTIPKPGRLPLSIQSLKEITLVVPQLYNLEPCSIRLKGVYGPEVKASEHSFSQHAKDHSAMTLMAHVNHLIQHLHEMAVVTSSPELSPKQLSTVPLVLVEKSETLDRDVEGTADADRPHLVFISHPPPEWSQFTTDDHVSSESDSEEYDSSEDSEDPAENATQGGASIPTSTTQPTLEKGILISFPQLEMTGMELLELKTLSISVKCDRCKQSREFKNIRPAESTTGSSIVAESCNKCNNNLSASYKPDLMHANSIKAGTLSLEGCTIQDLLPSTFQPTCSECSTPQPLSAAITTVRGDTALSICRSCHHKMTLLLPDVKFLLVSTADPRLHNNHLPPRLAKKENLGLTTGTPLPLSGRCPHYSKSYRWFRFSCCSRVYPCDRCHDAAEHHPNEHANRMICGWCSREQNYRPENCHFCGRSVVRKRGGGFWEGGKGTRDKVRMSRKDPRKYKRVGGAGGQEKK